MDDAIALKKRNEVLQEEILAIAWTRINVGSREKSANNRAPDICFLASLSMKPAARDSL